MAAAPALELAPGAGAGRGSRWPGRRPASCCITEGTYPYALGGVSSWCDLLVRGLTSSTGACCRSSRRTAARRCTSCPRTRARPGRSRSGRSALPRGAPRAEARRRCRACSCAGCWAGTATPTRCVAEWLWCRRHPAGRARAFRSARRLGGVPRRAAATCSPSACARRDAAAAGPRRGRRSSTRRCTGSRARRRCRRPPADVLHVTAAGWSAIPALVHKALHGTPMVLTEHGVYLREAYLAAARGGGSPGARFTATRLARGLARAAYAGADVICPVTDANAYWEMGLGHRPGEDPRALQRAAPARAADAAAGRGAWSCRSAGSTRSRTSTRCCAWPRETLRIVPDAQLPPLRRRSPRARRPTSRSCLALHARLGLGERFRFMGRTTDPNGAVRGRRRGADDEHLRRPADVGARGDERGPPDRLDRASAACPTSSRAAARWRAGRRPRAGDGGRDAAAQPRRSRGGSGSAATAGSGGSSTRQACVEGYRELLHTLIRASASRRECRHEPARRGGWSRRGSGARRRTRSRPRSCSRRGPACRRSGRSRRPGR